MEKQWHIKETPQLPLVASLADAINVNPAIAKILVQRGVTSFDEAKSYFRPSLDELHDPFQMKGMAAAVNRLSEALANDDKVLVYGDYDVDGTCSVATFFGFLKEFHENVEYYIPDRYTEGYGISEQGIDYAINNDVKLIVSIDCGIRAVKTVARARENNIDFIICDHHKPGNELPNANAILNPKQVDCNYPFDELCGCGVAFKLIQGFSQQNGIDAENAFRRLDFVAIATASDIVPMVGENRILTYFGIEQMKNQPNVGVRALLDIAGCEPKDLCVSKIVFAVGPRINAAGRLDHAHGAVDLLLEEDYDEALRKGHDINQFNLDRRELDSSIQEEALEMIEGDKELANSRSTVLFKANWHKGVIGIVASRCIECYYRPTIILTESNGKASGSARSVRGFDVHDAIAECADLLDQFGGHKYAAGLTMPIENVLAFRKKFEEVVTARILPEQLIPTVEIDAEISLNDITPKFYRIIEQMNPFGPKNMTPVFLATDVYDSGWGRVLKNKHLKLHLKQDGAQAFDAIGFGLGHLYDSIKDGQRFDVCFTVEMNVYNGRSNLQLNIRDLKMK